MAMVKKTNLKKTGGRKSTALIQSPTVKRIHSHPVTLQGWLQKRGSDGLMLWKKRWFVLSDYCLFYYKDQEEDILLGSFVLASWIISPCTHKDKVYKKYSFKAEHNNMRTYYFAADNDVIMAQWLKALTMASLLQESPRPTSKINNSQMNQLRHKEYNLHQQQQIARGYNYGYHSGRAMNADNQPLYVNAPPKPKRLNDGSTPDPNEEESRILMYQEGTSTSYYKSVNPNVAPGGFFPSGANRSLNANNVLPRNHVITPNMQPPITTASHYECLRTSYTIMNQIAKGSQPPRPRSVDFLEYENKNSHTTKTAGDPKLITLPRRPKSSMSISAPKDEPMDSTHWSEESYAKKMRESSMYVRPDNENSASSVRTGSSQQERDVISPSHENAVIHSASVQYRKRDGTGMDCDNDPNFFKRSASARLPEPLKDINDSYGSNHNHDALCSTLGSSDPKKAQLREVSMKRLLEWKERMLQSPLSQVLPPNASHIYEMANQPLGAVRLQNSKQPTSSFQLDNIPQYDVHNRNQDVLEVSRHSHRNEPEFSVENGGAVQPFNAYQLGEQTNVRLTQREAYDARTNNINDNDKLIKGQRRCESEHGKPLFDVTPIDYPHIENNAHYGVKQHGDSNMSYYNEGTEQGYPGKPSSVPNGFTPRDSPQSLVSRTPSSSKTMKEHSVNETDEEWGLKLDESSVIKEFSYHYIKNDGGERCPQRPKSATLPSNAHENARQQYHSHGTPSSPPTVSPHPQSYGSKDNPASIHEEVQPSSSWNKTLPVSILKNMKSKKKLDLDFTSDATNKRGQWKQSYPSKLHDKRQVFSDTETLLYETSSEADDREKPSAGSKFTNVSSDDDRDDEVAAVLAKEHKHSRPAMPEPNGKIPAIVRPSSSTISTNREIVTPHHNSLSCENITELPEENYMPMTPRKKSVPASPFKDSYEPRVASSTSNPENESLQGIEECPYVEMTQNNNNKIGSLSGPLEALSHSYLNPETKYSGSMSKQVESKRDQYDSAYNDISGQEPLYMEVCTVQNRNLENTTQLLSSGKKDVEDEDIRENTNIGSALPDILNTTAPTLIHHGSRRSDSSDADDEASKDLDSIDAPRHPRFSLSDTFRPASYYLGSSLSERAIIALHSDHPDSSDSDLVSPPPIPACSPPLDDLDTSIDSTINNKELILNNSKEGFLQGTGVTDKFRYGCGSRNSLKISNNETGSSEEESVKSERTRHYMKRRPLSADILNSLSDFNILDVPSPRDSVNCESFDKADSKSLFHNETSISNQTSSPIPEGPSNTYNPYRKNGFNKNKLFYDWNQPLTAEKYDQEAHDGDKLAGPSNIPVSANVRYEGESNPKVYNIIPSDYNVVGYEHSTMMNMCQDTVSPYANANAIAMVQHESQNAAPYYYSDLFKVDSRNSLNKINKPEDQVLFDKNIPASCYSDDLRLRDDTSGPKNVMMYPPDKAKYPPGIPNEFIPHHTVNAKNQYNYIPDEIRLENHRRSRSLEGLLDSKRHGMNELPPVHLPPRGCMTMKKNPPPVPVLYSSQAPQQDNRQMPKRTHWEDSSKKVNVRHSRSLEDLDLKADNEPVETFCHNKDEVVYANSDFTRKGQELSEQRVSDEKEREKIRQWDLMSSAPSTLGGCPNVHYKDNQGIPVKPSQLPSSIKQENHPPGPAPTEVQQKNWDLKFSAGDLLGRTHEELVLLLIQLRRQRAAVCKSMERCHREIEAHACLTDFDSINRLEHVQRLDELKSRLIELEKQYEKGKPLVNLVDNMVKLGSLYQSGPQSVPSEKLEFNHKVQEQRILADERRDWERIRADHQDLQSKVEQLYRLDKLLQEESGTLHNLQEDKGVLERALGGLKSKLQGIHGNTAETEWYRRQQRLLERELSRVRSILALNSKKLEETVAENARLEQELVVLRQKLQLSRRTTEPGGAATAALESELCRVQMLVGNLLRQRQELSSQVRQLTEKSNSLSQQIWPSLPDNIGHTLAKKKHTNSEWIETDLDVGGLSSPGNDDPSSTSRDHNLSPLYVNTGTTDKHAAYYGEQSSYPDDGIDELSPLNARSPDPYRSDFEDDVTKRACGSNWREKPQEIKTVRIVKRESERRQRDRDHRSGNIGIPITGTNKRVIPEEVVLDPISEKKYQDPIAEDSPVLAEPSEPPPTPGPRSDSVHAVWNLVRKNKLKGNILSGSPVETFDPPDFGVESPQLSPVYLSEAARKIVEEVAWQGRGEKRVVPRERRRHHTVSGLSISAPKHLYAQRGSRDDLDMERVLRPRLTTPDVVKSTLNRTDTSFTKETIDNILGAPGKIVIPERYIPESQPQLSKEEIMKRSKKADAIRRMLCETASAVTPKEAEVKERTYNVKHQVEEEKRNREHLLQLSQILAHEVMEKSKIVASVNSPLPQD